jgi:diguanylate cyclase (GGDEF)-like protein
MARKYSNSAQASGHTILVIDDSPDILGSSRRLLEAEGHTVVTAVDGPAGLAALERQPVNLILVDYFMPGMTGEEVVRRVRQRDQLVQIILQTGYSGEKPARVMLRELDIQGYHDKGDGAERLLLWVDSALKTYRHMLAMEKNRKGLRYILDLTPELHRLQPMDDLLEGLLWQVEALLGADNSFVATLNNDAPRAQEAGGNSEGFVALLDNTDLQIRFGTGRYSAGTGTGSLPSQERELIQEALRNGIACVHEAASAVPLVLGKRAVGVIYLDRKTGNGRDRELLEIFANQAAAAVQNSLLYDMATLDSLTGAYLRGFAIQQLRHALKRSMRRGDDLSLLMIDLDRFKQINDRYGHPAGDHALATAGRFLCESVRESDVVGRYGGDEFLVILPDTPADGAVIAANRLLESARTLHVEAEGSAIPIHLSIGTGTVSLSAQDAETLGDSQLIEMVADGLIASADRALYSAKGSGRAGEGGTLAWRDLLVPPAVSADHAA